MRVLVACEFSGIVREAFKKRGCDAYSCDLLDTEIPGNHIKDDVLKHLNENWDLMIAHPPCTHLAVSGARYFYKKQKEQKEALEFVRLLMSAPIDKICVENPISIISTHIRKPDQIIQPYQFGHGETKATCLWLKNLPKLRPTKEVPERERAEYGKSHLHRTDGRTEAAHIRELPMLWPNNGQNFLRDYSYGNLRDHQ